MRNVCVSPALQRAHIEDIISIDIQNFDCAPTSREVDRGLNFPWMFTILTYRSSNQERVAGYGMVVQLTKSAHKALKSGRMHETEIESRHIALPEDASGIYIASIATNRSLSLSEIRATALRSRLVGYTLGQLLRAPKEVFAIAITSNGSSICEENNMAAQLYEGPIHGVGSYAPRLYVKQPFVYQNFRRFSGRTPHG